MRNSAVDNLLHLGNVFSLEENFPKLIEVKKKLVELLPDSSECYVFLGHAYGYAEDYKNAIIAYKKGIELKEAVITSMLGISLDEIYSEKFAKEHVYTNPNLTDLADYIVFLANSLNKLGEIVDSVECISRALGIYKHLEWCKSYAFEVLGDIMCQYDKVGALRAYRKAIECHDKSGQDAHDNECTYLCTGDKDELVKKITEISKD